MQRLFAGRTLPRLPRITAVHPAALAAPPAPGVSAQSAHRGLSSTSHPGASAAGPARVLSPSNRTVSDLLSSTDAVCFDVDSTVITVEAIDEFAKFAGQAEAVAALTAQAMGGSVPFDVALQARLSLINPSADMLEKFLSKHAFHLTPGFQGLVDVLAHRKVPVYLVSGGFTQMIHPLADVLGVPRTRVFANTILFKPDGSYAGFDRDAPTSRDGGKAEVVRRLKGAHGYRVVAMVGDGATDMQARPPADVFVGYGGVVTRPAVAAGADWFVRDWAAFTAIVRG